MKTAVIGSIRLCGCGCGSHCHQDQGASSYNRFCGSHDDLLPAACYFLEPTKLDVLNKLYIFVEDFMEEDFDATDARRERLLRAWTPERIAAHIAARKEWEKDMDLLRKLFPQLFPKRESLPTFKDFCKSRQSSQP